MRREPRCTGGTRVRRDEPSRRTVRRGGGPRRAPWFALLIVAACAGSARGDDVSLNVDDGQGVYHVQGAFTAPVSTSLAWTVLTDYDHIGEYVRSVKASRVEGRGEGWVLLRQDARGGFFPLQRTVHVLLDVHEQPEGQITFVDRLGRDFRSYRGEWNVRRATGGAVEVSYTLEARPMAAMPHALGRSWIGHAARELLEQVRAEMIRRDHTAAGPPEPDGSAPAQAGGSGVPVTPTGGI